MRVPKLKYTAEEQKDQAEFVKAQLKASGEDKEWFVNVAAENELQLDFDSPEIPAQFYRMIPILAQVMQANITWRRNTSRSGNVHVIITLPDPLNFPQRVAWQAILGSDPMREGLNMLSESRNEKNVILLVSKIQEPDYIRYEIVYIGPPNRQLTAGE
jgi:hypothetical protein